MHIERTMYKVLIVGLLAYVIAQGFGFYQSVIVIWQFPSFGVGSWRFVFGVVVAFGWFLMSLAALYWIPKFVKKFFPEVEA